MRTLEAEWRELSAKERLNKHQETLAPLMTTFFDWYREQIVLPGSKLGRALDYSLKYEKTFKTILEDGRLVMSNNIAERAIIMSLLETAKRHGLNSEKYISYLRFFISWDVVKQSIPRLFYYVP